MTRSLDRMSMAAKGRRPGAAPGNRGADGFARTVPLESLLRTLFPQRRGVV